MIIKIWLLNREWLQNYGHVLKPYPRIQAEVSDHSSSLTYGSSGRRSFYVTNQASYARGLKVRDAGLSTVDDLASDPSASRFLVTATLPWLLIWSRVGTTVFLRSGFSLRPAYLCFQFLKDRAFPSFVHSSARLEAQRCVADLRLLAAHACFWLIEGETESPQTKDRQNLGTIAPHLSS